MFNNAFPAFKSNIEQLKFIGTRLNTIDTTGHEVQVNSIREKLYEPDQAQAAEAELNELQVKLGVAPTPAVGALPKGIGTTPGVTPELPAIDEMLPQLLPATATEEPVAETELDQATPDTDTVPADVELPPDIGLPPDATTPTVAPAPSAAPGQPQPEQQSAENPQEKKDETQQ